MRRSAIGMVCLFVLGTVAMARGQVDLRLTIDPDTVLTHESILARVSVGNVGAQDVVLNAPDGSGPQLEFRVETDHGVRVATREGATYAMQTVPAGKRSVLPVDLTSHFVLTHPGRYFVYALLRGGSVDVRSSLKVVDVVPGLEVGHAEGIVPGGQGARRTYSLRYWSRDQRDHLFLCVTDAPSGQVFAPIHLGVMVRVMEPNITVGRDGTVTVYHQVSRSQMMVTTLESKRDRISLVDQQAMRMPAGRKPKPPALPPR